MVEPWHSQGLDRSPFNRMPDGGTRSYGVGVPLLLVDLDNTLVDRATAFAAFARDFTAALGRPPADVAWMIEVDGDGFTPRLDVAEAIRTRFALSGRDTDELLATLRAGLVDRMELDPEVLPALNRARRAGWTTAIVTNGTEAQQSRKIDTLGLRPSFAAVAISEAAGVRKPDPAIFHKAAAEAGSDLAGAWMIGDSAAADIGGAQAVGIDSVWLHRGREWPTDLPEPSHQADSFAEAVDLVLAAAG